MTDSNAAKRRINLDRIDYSQRRYFVDIFHFEEVEKITAGSLVLDLGGNKINKRGEFDIGKYRLKVFYANLSTVKKPDVQALAEAVPFASSSFSAVICAELLEHVKNPRLVLQEIFRLLQPGGKLILCVPFFVNLHGDPHDYGRYTHTYWQELLAELNFSNINIKKQGLFWSCSVDMLRHWLYELFKQKKLKADRLRSFCNRTIGILRRKAIIRDATAAEDKNAFQNSYTTGFAVTATKPEEPAKY